MLRFLAPIILVTACAMPNQADEPAAPETAGTSQAGSTDPASPSTGSGSSDSPAAGQASGTVITTGESQFGPVLFDEADQAIYIWQVEKSSTPKCYDDCATAWPPVLTDGPPAAGGDVEAALLGTVERRDGSVQVTYGGRPLYYYAHEGPGDVKCHNIATHGGLWWAVQPNGERVR